MIDKSWENVFFLKIDINKQIKNGPGRDAGHRSPCWGCTKTPISNKNLRKIEKIRKSTPRQT